MAGLNLGLAQGGTGAGLYDGLAQWLKQRQQTALVDQDLAMGDRKMRLEDEDRAVAAQEKASGQQAMEAAMRAIDESDLPPLQKLVAKVNLMSGKGLSVPEAKARRTSTIKSGTEQLLIDEETGEEIKRFPGEAPAPQGPKVRVQSGLRGDKGPVVAGIDETTGQRLWEQPEHERPERQQSASVIIGVPTVDENGRPVMRYMTKGEAREGSTFPRPTAEQINQGMSRERAAPVLQAIAELSERINVQTGTMAKIQGAAARAQAKLNLDDDVAEYEALVNGFTPLLARALGHTGVLTEQDVQSARQVLPNPMDSRSVRDRKIARVQSIMAAVASTGRTGATGAAGASPQQADPLGIR